MQAATMEAARSSSIRDDHSANKVRRGWAVTPSGLDMYIFDALRNACAGYLTSQAGQFILECFGLSTCRRYSVPRFFCNK